MSGSPKLRGCEIQLSEVTAALQINLTYKEALFGVKRFSQSSDECLNEATTSFWLLSDVNWAQRMSRAGTVRCRKPNILLHMLPPPPLSVSTLLFLSPSLLHT